MHVEELVAWRWDDAPHTSHEHIVPVAHNDHVRGTQSGHMLGNLTCDQMPSGGIPIESDSVLQLQVGS